MQVVHKDLVLQMTVISQESLWWHEKRVFWARIGYKTSLSPTWATWQDSVSGRDGVGRAYE